LEGRFSRIDPTVSRLTRTGTAFKSGRYLTPQSGRSSLAPTGSNPVRRARLRVKPRPALANVPPDVSWKSSWLALASDGWKWSGRWESNPRLKLGKLGYYHYTTPASGSDSMRLATYQANRRPDKGKAPCGALPIVQVSVDFALVELVVRRELQSTSEDSLEIRGGPWRVVAARAGDRRERRLLVEHVVDNEPHLELGVKFHADG
jgi:hypothetical protein